MPTYEISLSTTFYCDFTITADSKDEAIAEAEDRASDSRHIYLKSMHEGTSIHNVDQDEPSEDDDSSEDDDAV